MATVATTVLDAAGDNGGRGGKQQQRDEGRDGLDDDEAAEMLVDNEDVKAYIRNCRAYDVSKQPTRACEKGGEGRG